MNYKIKVIENFLEKEDILNLNSINFYQPQQMVYQPFIMK